jgi:hypothetical protein
MPDNSFVPGVAVYSPRGKLSVGRRALGRTESLALHGNYGCCFGATRISRGTRLTSVASSRAPRSDGISKTHQMSAREVALGQTPAAATMTRS